jgi:cysteine desulfurase
VVGTAKSRKSKGNHIITTKIEHHALLHTCKQLEKEGFDVTYLDVDKSGLISLKQLKDSITDKTILISIMYANNEVGSIQPVREIASIAKEKGILFHSDAVQALGNVPINVKDLGIDLLSVSAHKIYGPKGVGALYVRKGLTITNLLQGGGQEYKRRAGTENLPGIVGFGKAAQLAGENLDNHITTITELRNYFLAEIQKRIPDVDVNGGMVHRLPGNLNLVFNYVEGEAMILYMDMKGIYASTGSACSSASFSASHVLAAMGLPVEKAYSSVRFTLGDFTTKDDIDFAVNEITMIVEKLRSISPFDKEHDMETAQNCNCPA